MNWVTSRSGSEQPLAGDIFCLSVWHVNSTTSSIKRHVKKYNIFYLYAVIYRKTPSIWIGVRCSHAWITERSQTMLVKCWYIGNRVTEFRDQATTRMTRLGDETRFKRSGIQIIGLLQGLRFTQSQNISHTGWTLALRCPGAEPGSPGPCTVAMSTCIYLFICKQINRICRNGSLIMEDVPLLKPAKQVFRLLI